MLGKINPKQMDKMMRQMGMKSLDIDASEVIIKCKDKDIVITNPGVQKILMMGQESFQITGVINERSIDVFSNEDVLMVAEQTGVSEDEAKAALKNTNGEIAEAIMSLKKDD
ncbi:MAG: nascent polypeptide-associated complex protein [Candidatus Aenigmarchaeota archaeon]|nr:nascent polypeptide-associated complex protein [Candidatus Aenigmarchaeota archaeon]